jgi:hypothetical protein
MATKAYITAAVEGITDEAVIRAVAAIVGLEVTAVYGKYGKVNLREKLPAYNYAAVYSPWVVLTDLDDDAECAPPLKQKLLPRPAPQMCFRIAVREVESWVLADSERVASFFAVRKSQVPVDPELVPSPKQSLVNLVRRSTRRAIREDMVPREGSGRSVGPAYASRLIEFVSDRRKGWRCHVAARRADSLRRCIECLKRLRQPSPGRQSGRPESRR